MGCASLEERRKFFLGLQMYRAVSLQRPQYLSEILEVRRRSFSIMGARLWNELPLAVHDAESLPLFRRRLRTYLANRR
ncbi:hypothetical protein TKK_0016614 [Trichogramma kaykai]